MPVSELVNFKNGKNYIFYRAMRENIAKRLSIGSERRLYVVVLLSLFQRAD